MVKTHWVRNAAILGTAVTLSLVPYSAAEDVSAASISQETEMAGLSLTLNDYYTTNYTGVSNEKDTVKTVAASAKTSENTTAVQNTSAKKKTAAKKETVSKKWQTTGISIANDYVNIRKKPSTENSKVIGRLYRGSSAKILKEKKNGWVQVKSGNVRGYIKKEYLAVGKSAEKLSGKYGKKYIKVKKGVVTLNVREKTSTKSTILVQIPEDERFRVEKECGKNWIKISLDDSHGYVAREFVDVNVSFKKAVSMKEIRAKRRRKAAAARAERERAAARAAARASRKSSSNTSTKSSSARKKSSNAGSSVSYSKGSGTGAQIVSYAKKFLGNKYVYGGTSLTNGTDCSGFTMSVYAAFGYSIPRTSREQSRYGKSVSLSSVKPGDLIFYKNGSSVGHVALYMGGGNVIHASNRVDGIKISNMYYRTPYCARRII
ncbi:MAG: NlpC/P60 family protein [Lachnospiraceae bacterium]|nr:NlpC/P60 family protein [Lachnospiraceae bacterium]MCI5588675.1 NlpC/P60 family protein [Lachnospiraceae bacterium]